MNLNTAQINQKLNDLTLRFKSLEKDEKIAWGVLVLGVILVIIALLMI